jgi:hypothetical protein
MSGCVGSIWVHMVPADVGAGRAVHTLAQNMDRSTDNVRLLVRRKPVADLILVMSDLCVPLGILPACVGVMILHLGTLGSALPHH